MTGAHGGTGHTNGDDGRGTRHNDADRRGGGGKGGTGWRRADDGRGGDDDSGGGAVAPVVRCRAPDVWALARGIAAVLGKTMPPPIRTITRVVDRLGPDRARAFLGQALTIEAQGGLTLPDGRRRTPGGVFFHLVRTSDAICREDKAYIFPRQGERPTRAGGSGTPAAAHTGDRPRNGLDGPGALVIDEWTHRVFV